MRRAVLLPLAAVVSLGLGSCHHKAPVVRVVNPDEVHVTPASDRAYFSLEYPGDFQVCLEMERNGQKVCQDLAILRPQFAGLHKVEP